MNHPLNTIPQQHQGQQVATRNLGQLIANLGPQSSLVAQSTVDPRALAAGIKPSFASITFKGKTWGIRHRGVTQQLLVRDPATQQVIGSLPTIDVVIVKSATAISKSFYIEKYKEGDFNQPDCWSTNGQVPDMAAPKKQSETCRGCRWDAFGSRTMDDGRKGKACSDNKRVAVVPAADIKNEAFGGPMLLKLPPSGFAGLSELENQLHMQGYHYYAIKMRLSFDHTVAYPKIVFTPFAVLNDHEMQEVINWQTNEIVERILSEELFEVSGDPGQPTPDQQGTGYVPPPVSTGPVVVPQQGQALNTAPPPPPVAQPIVAQPIAGSQPQMPTQGNQPNPTAAFVTTPVAVTQSASVPHAGAPVTQGNDPGAPPPFLQTGTPEHAAAVARAAAAKAANGAAQPAQETPEQKIARMEAELAALKAPPPPPPETPEQKIARLEAQLAQATAKPATAPAQGRRKRSQPVTPTGGQPAVAVTPPTANPPADVPLPFTAQATAAASNPTPVDQTEQGGGEDDGEGEDTPPDLDSRIDQLLSGGGTA